MYGPDTADVYDSLYSARGKDYVHEAKVISEVIMTHNPNARSLLDVACGTGEHLKQFDSQFDDVAGVELSRPMVDIARRKLPNVEFRIGDMRMFEFGRTFDAVTSMFASIGYAGSVAGLSETIHRMAAHLNPGGVVVVDSSFDPNTWVEGHVSRDDYVIDGDEIGTRMSHSSQAERLAIMDVHHLIGNGAGINHFRERHELYMFTVAEYEAAFRDAGLTVHREPDLLNGLYIGAVGDLLEVSA